METRFSAFNRQWEDPLRFSEIDSDLRLLKTSHYLYSCPLLQELPLEVPGVYTLSGGHRTGKTVLLKQWIEKLLQQGKSAQSIVYLPAESLMNYHELEAVLKKQLARLPESGVLYFAVDNITAVRDWYKGIKTLTAQLDRMVLLISGVTVDLALEAKSSLPSLHRKDFRLFPLSFRETVLLKHGDSPSAENISEAFNAYLLHGGYLHAINEIAANGALAEKSLQAYVEWIQQQVIKSGRHEHYLREILHAILRHYEEPLTWNALAQELTIDHPKTIGDYFAILQNVQVIYIQYALQEETLNAAPKKARKLMFVDPYLFHAVKVWLSSSKHYIAEIVSTFENAERCSRLVESCVVAQYDRHYPTFYIKDEGETHLAYVSDHRFWPIAVLWTKQVRAKDLKQILKYSNGRIFTKTERSGIIEHIRTEPLPFALWQLERKKER